MPLVGDFLFGDRGLDDHLDLHRTARAKRDGSPPPDINFLLARPAIVADRPALFKPLILIRKISLALNEPALLGAAQCTGQQRCARAPEARSGTFRDGEDDTFAHSNRGGFT
jgi:hypothetical protein